MIIFDFDQTLVDTRVHEDLRKGRKWKAVMARLEELEVYEGISELLRELHEQNKKLAIVTKSPDMIPREFISLHNWPIEIVIGPHQAKKRKPAPDGMHMAMQIAGASAQGTYHVGDRPEDTQAARAANVVAIGAGWGTDDIRALEASEPDHLFLTVRDMREFFVNILYSM